MKIKTDKIQIPGFFNPSANIKRSSFSTQSDPGRDKQLIDGIREQLNVIPDPKDIVEHLIHKLHDNLHRDINKADTPDKIQKALVDWEYELFILSSALPEALQGNREYFSNLVDNIMLEKRGERFHAVLRGQNHIVNRAVLLIKHGDEIKNLYGYDSKTALCALSVLVIQTLLAGAMNDASWGYFFFVMVFVGSVLNHTAGMAIHEASHNLAAPTPELNRAVSILSNLPFGVPHQANFDRYHMDHHTYLGQPKRDNDLPSPALARWVGNSSTRKAIWLLFYPLAYAITQKPDSPNGKQLANICIQLGWDIGIVYFLGPWALAYLIGSTLIGFSALNPVAAHWIDEHFERNNDGQETHSYYGWLNWLNFNVGYHNEHHDFPKIPGSRLPQLRRIAKEHYDKQKGGSSWVNSIWQFINDPEISAYSRIIRTSASEHATNVEAVKLLKENYSPGPGM